MKKKLLIAALLTLTTLPVMAADFYLIADVGQGKVDIDAEDFSLNETTTAISLGGGYQINKILALEVAYRDLGEFNLNYYADLGGGDYVRSRSEHNIAALQASLVAQLPLSESAAFYVRLGVGSLRAKTDHTGEMVLGGVESSESGSDSNNKTKAVFGVGFKYALSQTFALRAEYSQYAEWDEVTVSSTTVGLTYKF